MARSATRHAVCRTPSGRFYVWQSDAEGHAGCELRRCSVNPERLKSRLAGCYVTIPTPFGDDDGFPVNHKALRSYVRFLIESGLTTDYATLLAGGAAGDFSTMTFAEGVAVAETVADEANGRVPLAFG